MTYGLQNVDGHKDKLVPYTDLTPYEKLNCLADWDSLLWAYPTRLYPDN